MGKNGRKWRTLRTHNFGFTGSNFTKLGMISSQMLMTKLWRSEDHEVKITEKEPLSFVNWCVEKRCKYPCWSDGS